MGSARVVTRRAGQGIRQKACAGAAKAIRPEAAEMSVLTFILAGGVSSDAP